MWITVENVLHGFTPFIHNGNIPKTAAVRENEEFSPFSTASITIY